MIISAGRRYILVHAPKTGGTALSLALEARAMKDDILIGDTPKARARRKRLAALTPAGRLWKHSTLADIAGVVSDEQLASWFILTLVRNPWDRMVSYYHWLRGQNFDHPAVHLARATDFAGFVSDPATLAAWQNASHASYVTDRNGVERCSLFARLEHLGADLATFEDHLGFKLGSIPAVNRSLRDPDYRVYYDDRTTELVAKAAKADISRFNYRF